MATLYEPVIGLEVHAEMLTQSKMFCGCRVVDSVTAPPNTAVCPVCLGMPGMLPVINRAAVALAIRVGLALNCTIKTHNVFARKNYFYPDLPKGYQISQYELPLCENGWLDITLPDGGGKRIGVTRVHMEEDTGKLTHLGDGRSLVDYNRSSVPLLEIVSEPDLRSSEEVYAYAAKLRQLLRYLEVNSGDMEKGVIRFEANISVRPAGSDTLGVRTEVKNLNSFRALTGATDYEIARQSRLLDGGKHVVQETLGWNESREITYSQRSKEDAHDYRYFPEPDLPPLAIADEWVTEIAAGLPELPDSKVARYASDFELSDYEAKLLAEDRATSEWFDAAVSVGGDPKLVANWLLNNLFTLINEHKTPITDLKIQPIDLVALLKLLERRVINNNTAKDVLAEMFVTGDAPHDIVAARGLAQIADESIIGRMVESVLEDNPRQVAEYLTGKTKLHGFFVGQVMRASRGKADPELVNRLLAAALAARRG